MTHHIDIERRPGTVTVTAGDTVIARSEDPLLLFETGYPVRAYLDRSEVLAEVEPHAGKHTTCPYKGVASYWTVAGVEDAAWSYDDPLTAVAAIAGRLAFDPARVTVEIAFS